MSVEWPEISIDELKAPTKNAIAMGPFGSRIKAENFVNSGIPVIKGGNLNGDFLLEEKFDFLLEVKADELISSNCYRRDIVITHRGTIGQVGIIPDNSKYERYVASQSQLKVSLDEDKVNPYFVYYFLRSPLGQQRLLLNASQVGVPAIARASSSVKKILVPYPKRDIQDKIVEMMLSLDRKTANNRQINLTLEQIAQSIFKSWFVDFEPVKAKIETKQNGQDPERAAMCTISGKSEADLDQLSSDQLAQLAATAALFPDELVESEQGLIPEGWKVKTIEGVTSHIIDHRGKTPKKLGGAWSESGFAAISAKNIKNGRIINHSSIRYVDEALYQQWMNVELGVGDILLTSEAPMGQMYFLAEETKYLLSQRLYGLRANTELATAAYLYLWLQTTQAKSDMESRATGTTVVGIRQSELRKIKVLSPNIKLLNKFEDLVIPIYQDMHLNENQTVKLNQLQETLLPKLLSGDIAFNSYEGASG
ncbi:MAG: restriction endonuclease subunit S [Proteobacteria bacterium]|nr:restriction endonuclease subunit S [Pseudomonadota bacterium]